MTVGAGIAVQDGSLLALGAEVLREVRPNVLVTPAAGGGLTNGAFLGVRSAPAGSRSVFPVGKLRYGAALHSACLLFRPLPLGTIQIHLQC
jgi:raffinose synthase